MIKVLLIVFIITNIVSASIVIAVAKRHCKSSKVDCSNCKHCKADTGSSLNGYRYRTDNTCPLGLHDSSPLSCAFYDDRRVQE